MTGSRAGDVLRADAIMSSPVITVAQDQSLWDAWTRMSGSGVRHVVVTDRDRCVGVIDDRRLVAAWPQGPSSMRHNAVRSALDERTACVLPDASLSTVAAIMNANLVDAVPVVDGTGKVLGLVTAVDLVRAVARWGVDAHPIDESGPSAK